MSAHGAIFHFWSIQTAGRLLRAVKRFIKCAHSPAVTGLNSVQRSEKKEMFMRSRFLAVLLGAVLAMGLAACSKKEQPAQAPPVATDQAAQQAPAATPQTQAAPGQTDAPAASPGEAPAATPAAEPAAPPAAA